MERLEKDPEIGFDTEARFDIPFDMDITIDCEAYEPLYQEDELEDEFDIINED